MKHQRYSKQHTKIWINPSREETHKKRTSMHLCMRQEDDIEAVKKQKVVNIQKRQIGYRGLYPVNSKCQKPNRTEQNKTTQDKTRSDSKKFYIPFPMIFFFFFFSFMRGVGASLKHRECVDVA